MVIQLKQPNGRPEKPRMRADCVWWTPPYCGRGGDDGRKAVQAATAAQFKS